MGTMRQKAWKHRIRRIVKRVAGILSSLIAGNPRIIFGLQQQWLKFGYHVLDLKMAAWVIRRPEWLMTKSSAVPALIAPELPDSTSIDESIAKRLIGRYKAIREGERSSPNLIPENSMWGTLRQDHYSHLRGLVEKGDSRELSQYLAKIFRTETVNGYSLGTQFDTLPHRWPYLAVGIELSIVTLAECLGILRAENHEQGRTAYWRLEFSEEQLMNALEAHFGFRIEAPRFGDPRGIIFGGRFIARETCSHLYTAHRMREIFSREGIVDPLQIVEIGGGYGGACYWVRKLLGNRVATYTIIDLPEVGLVQAYFLGSVDPSSLVLPGEAREDISSPIELVPYFNLEQVDFKPNVLFNQDSMPEMPQSEVERYVKWGSENLKGLFLSFNQEAYSPWAGTLQVLVPSVVSQFPQYHRLSRETSWDRRGYVEEVYSTLKH